MTTSLRPEENITKILLSTPSYLVGEYEEEDFLLTIAFGNERRYDPRNKEYFALTVKTPPPRRSAGAIMPDYSGTGDVLSIYLSILYGKRFDNHGIIESLGLFRLPNYFHFNNYDLDLPFNNRNPRRDLEIPLSLHEVKRIAPLLHEGEVDPHFDNFLISAGRFYVHALQHAETQPEVAFLDLITCGEILSNFYDYDQDILLDDEIKKDLIRIEKEINNGREITQHVRNRLYSVKRRFVKTLHYLLNPYFFRQSEGKSKWYRLDENDISTRIKAAYDLRSKYVHSGVNFGRLVEPFGGRNNEIQCGEPVIEDPEFRKIITRSPTLIGMERIMRFCLLRFMHTNGIFIDLKLEGRGLKMPEDATNDGEELA